MNISGPFLVWNRFIRLAEAFLKAVLAGLLLISLSLMAAGAAEPRTAWYGAARPKPPASATANLRYASLPLAFEQNRGQAAPAVELLARGSGFAVFFTNKEVVLSLERSAGNTHASASATGMTGRAARGRKMRKDVLRFCWAGASAAPKVEGVRKESGKSNYLVGHNPARWLKAVPSFSRVEYHGLYPGIDLVYYGNRRELEFDLDVAPGADLSAVRLQIAGEKKDAAKMRVNSAGELVVHTRAGDVRFRKPVAWQPGGNSRKHILAARYVMAKGGQVGFEVSGYDSTKPLVIDPVLSYSTYLGGTDYNYANDIAVDSSGNTYITGYTSSVDFPITGGVQGTFASGSCDTEVNTAPCFDAFIAKLNPMGTGLVFSTYLGGTGDDEGVRIAVDSTGQAYVAGFTDSNDFPTAGPLQGSNGGGACGTTAYPTPCYDAFVAKLTAAGSNLVYSTYLGGTGDDFASSIAADANGNAYVGGLTSASNFPVTYGTLQTSFGGGPFDGFVAKINPTGSSLVYSTYIGGSQEDHVNGIALDSAGDAFLTGQTNSSNFPVKGGFQSKYTGASCGSALSNFPCFESFVSELNPTGTALVYSSYLGGSAASYGSDIALDSSGAAYVAGWTTSKDFPVTQGAYDTSWGGANEIFVAKIAAGGGALSYATYLGDIYPGQANSIAVDSSGNAWIAGFTYGGKFPVASPLQASSGGIYDAIVSEINPTGSALLFSTYLGGTGDDAATGLALDASGNVYVAGETFSSDFPITPSAMTAGYTGGSYDAWIAKIGPQNSAGLTASPNPLVFTGQEVNTASAPSALKIGDAGSAALSISAISVTGPFAETSPCGTVSPGTTCAMNVTYTPTAIGAQTGSLVITDNAAGTPHTVQLRGTGTSGAVSLSASALNFGSIELGATSTQTVTLTNPSQSPLNISSIQAGGDYSESNDCGSLVNAGASCTIRVTFTPSALGTSVGTVTIADTGLGSPQTITLTGTGAPPFTLAANPSSDTVLMGTGQVQFTISASTLAGFTGSIALACTNVSPASCAFSPSSIVPGQSSTLTVGNLNVVTSSALNFNVTGTASTTTASSAGSSTNATSSSNATATLALSVQFSDFTLAASPASATIQAGQTAKYTLTVTPVNGFDVPVTLACNGLPKGATCSFSSSTVQMSASGGAQATLTIHTTARSLAPPPSDNWRGWPLPCHPLWLVCAFLIFALFSSAIRRRQQAVAFRIATLAFLVCVSMAACGGGGGGGGGGVSPGSNNGTPAGTYTVDITATAQSLSYSSQVTLKVQ